MDRDLVQRLLAIVKDPGATAAARHNAAELLRLRHRDVPEELFAEVTRTVLQRAVRRTSTPPPRE